VLKGNVFGQPQIINVLPDERIKPGEPVITSGGDQIFPRGLPVGTVEEVVDDPDNDPYKNVIIKPAANLSHLEEVLVITQISDQLPPSAQRDIVKSEAAAAVDADKQRASDILAEKLPGLVDPDAPPDADVDKGPTSTETGQIMKPMQPLKAVHPDKYSPDSVAPASALVPGAPNTRTTYSASPSHSSVDGTSPSTAAPRPPAKPRPTVPAGTQDGAGSTEPVTKSRPKPRPVTPPASTDEPPTIQQSPPAAASGPAPLADREPSTHVSGGNR
jgi:rod shape-determining protein MreC